MGVEIDMLAVGDGARSGDAIAVRYGDALRGYRVMIIDGGTKASGERLVQHVRNVYGTNRVDEIVNSHPDGDHASGLAVVVDQLEVGQLWMHRPWNYAENIRHLFHDGRITDNSLEQRFREALQSAHELEAAALARKIPIVEPYQGSQVGSFTVLSPSHDWYLSDLVPNFRGAPALKQETALDAMLKTILDAAKAGVKWAQETLDIETLSEDGRHRDDRLDTHTKQRYKAFLQSAIPGLIFPDASGETADPEGADEAYYSATRWLLTQTRDKRTYSLLFEWNISYGFRRNMLGLRRFGIFVSAVMLAITVAENVRVAVTTGHTEGTVIIGSLVALAGLWFWITVVKTAWVEIAANGYARELLAACDRLPSPAKRKTPAPASA